MSAVPFSVKSEFWAFGPANEGKVKAKSLKAAD